MSTTPKPPASPMEEFFTRDDSNAGFRLPLYRPDGSKSAHWVHIQGVDSDAMHKAKSGQGRRALEITRIKNDKERELAALDALCDMLAHIIKDWSFSDAKLMAPAKAIKCTHAEVKKFLINAPQIRERIDTIISDRALFFRMQAESLKTTP